MIYKREEEKNILSTLLIHKSLFLTPEFKYQGRIRTQNFQILPKEYRERESSDQRISLSSGEFWFLKG